MEQTDKAPKAPQAQHAQKAQQAPATQTPLPRESLAAPALQTLEKI